MGRGHLGLALGLISCACARDPAPPPAEALIGAVEVTGCTDLRTGPLCEVDAAGPITVWVAAPSDAQLTARWGGSTARAEWTAAGEGRRAELIVTATTTSLIIEARRRGLDARRWDVRLRPRHPEITEARRLLAADRGAEAELVLTRLSSGTPSRDASEAARVLGGVASRRGDLLAAQHHWLRASELARAAALPARAANDRMSAAFVAINNARDLPRGRALLDEVGVMLPPEDAPGRANLAFYRALLASHVGDLRAALTHLDAAEASAHRLGMRRLSWSARHGRAGVLELLGQHSAALEQLAGLSPSGPCDEAALALSRTWIGLSAVEGGAPAPAELPAHAARAAELHRTTCPDPSGAANMDVNLALMELQRGDWDAAGRAIADARKHGAEQLEELRLWLHDLEGRRALGQDQPGRALAHFEALHREGERSGLATVTWRASIGRASALAALGRTSEARAAYAEARRSLRREALAVTSGGWRAHFVASRRRADQAEIELLLSSADPWPAITTIRQARMDALRSLTRPARLGALDGAARSRWDRAVSRHAAAQQALAELNARAWGEAGDRSGAREHRRRALQAERLASLDEGLDALGQDDVTIPEALEVATDEVVLGYFPISGTGADPSDRWIGFAVTASTARIERLAGPVAPRAAPAEVARALLSPFAAELSRATRIRFLVEGHLAAVDLHALPWTAGPLVASHAVRYALDLPQLPAAPPGPTWVIADPLGDLPAARDEAGRVRALLTRRGTLPRVEIGAAATRARLDEALATSGHLHFAGHGRAAGGRALDDQLLLADGVLTLGDLLLAPLVPSRVILASCETARTAALGGIQVGMAHGFLIAGAQEVLASTRAVDDRLALTIVEHLYAEPDQRLDLALQRAQRALSQASGGDWAAFRVLSR